MQVVLMYQALLRYEKELLSSNDGLIITFNKLGNAVFDTAPPYLSNDLKLHCAL